MSNILSERVVMRCYQNVLLA